MDLEEFNYELPEHRIATKPVEPRDSSKLLVCQAEGRLSEWQSPFTYEHHTFREIADFLGPNDFLIFNDAKVLPVRLLGHRDGGGGAVEALLLKKISEFEWIALLHLSAKIRPGMSFVFEPGLVAEVVSTHEERVANEGEVRLRFRGFTVERIGMEKWLERHGHVPLPHYMQRDDAASDKQTYQTVYAKSSGSAAAPTAGFHFTPELLEKLRAQGVKMAWVTLHIGIGTFRPIKTPNIHDHVMHEETFEITPEFLAALEEAKKEGRRIVAVGTTVVRTLESWAAQGGYLEKKEGVFKTRLYIKPPDTKFQLVDDLITNFHLPKSSLIVMIGAGMGIEGMRKAYQQALAHDYRFFSYGDAMFIRGR